MNKNLMSKVPEATVFFWIIKVLTTGMGETTSDYFANRFDPVIVVILALLGLIAALVFQFSKRRYVPWVYWLTVIMVSIFGTMAADALHVLLGIPYIISTSFYVVVLAIIFITWYIYEKTLSIHSIYTRRREGFYWATVLATFALGTAAGDMTATTMHLGYFSSGLLFAALIVIPIIGYWKFKFNGIFAFWFAYVLTRPIGASFADWMGVSKARSGLGFGTGPISLILFVVIIILVAYMTYAHEDVERRNEI
jgi:uncharacterized membrane-anchored protein